MMEEVKKTEKAGEVRSTTVTLALKRQFFTLIIIIDEIFIVA